MISPMAQAKFVPVMLTPFKENGEVDYQGLTRLTTYYLEAGAAGLFANCLSSEMFELSEEERIKVTRHVVEVTGGAVPVVSTGTFGGPIALQAEFVKKIYDTGTSAVIAITGLLAEKEASSAVFHERALDLLDKTGSIPLGFYECPVPYKRVLKPDELGAIVASGRIVYHKDTSLDIASIREKLARTQGYSFELYDAYMEHAVESLKAGSAGLSCIQGNYFPELIVWLCRHFNDPDKREEVNLVQKFLIVTMDVIHDVYPISAKYFLARNGFPIQLFTRRAVGDFSTKVRENVDALFKNYTQLRHDIGLVESIRI